MKDDKKSRIGAIISGSLGNLVEWYDWYVYASFSLYFAPVFFPEGNSTAQLLNTAGIFAAGFLMRPLGGWLFGRLADRKGRKFAMTFSVVVMSMGSLLIAVTPSFKTIGVAAPMLLLSARLLQGLSVGGEYGISATYLTEMALKNRRGFYSSFQYVTMIGGQLVALGIQLLLQYYFLTSAELHEWGWRIPFFIGALLSLVVFYLRVRMPETPVFSRQSEHTIEEKGGTLKEVMKFPRSLILVAGLTLGGTLAFYTFSTYMQKFLVNTVHLDKEKATLISFLALLIYALIQPLFGILSDRIGRKPLLMGFGIFGTLFTIPIFNAIASSSGQWEAFAYMMIALVIVSGYSSINAAVKAELFPTRVRALGIGLSHSLAVAIFGGTAEYVALWFKNAGHETWFYWYVSGCIFISLVVYTLMKDTKNVTM